MEQQKKWKGPWTWLQMYRCNYCGHWEVDQHMEVLFIALSISLSLSPLSSLLQSYRGIFSVFYFSNENTINLFKNASMKIKSISTDIT